MFNSFGNDFGFEGIGRRRRSLVLVIILVWGRHWGRRCSIVLAIILDLGALGEEVFNSFVNYFGFRGIGGGDVSTVVAIILDLGALGGGVQ